MRLLSHFHLVIVPSLAALVVADFHVLNCFQLSHGPQGSIPLAYAIPSNQYGCPQSSSAKITARNDFGEAALVTPDATSWSVQELCKAPFTNATMPVIGTGRAVTLSPGRGNETVIGTCDQMSPEGELDCSEDLICFDAWVCYSEEVCPNGNPTQSE